MVEERNEIGHERFLFCLDFKKAVKLFWGKKEYDI